jgi:hypothetical protein
MWAVLDGDGPLLLEEPELSLHPAVVRYLPAMFARALGDSDRQLFISTQSPDFLSDPGIGLDEVFLLVPREEGTQIEAATSVPDAQSLLEGGVPMSEIVLAQTRPKAADQLALFPY